MNNPEFTQHLIELRKRLIFIIIGLVICMGLLFPFCNQIYAFIIKPVGIYLPKNTQMIATDIISPFFVPIKLTFLVAIFISLPNTIYQTWQFIAPALYRQEKSLLLGVVVSSLLLFASGILFCYFLVLPAIFHFISGFKLSEITMMTDITKYLDFVLSLFTTFGLAFETPVIVFLLIYLGILPIEKARQIRKYILVGAFIVAAIVTPPDVFSQTMLAVPLYCLYEIGLLVSRLIPSKDS
ncbi:MAG: twin-arginine translocase subunit TatC [Burkholderiales bacterium]|nr:twin-arginine translocase subunit TatC [Burkholderiales bacterium]